MEIVIIGTGNAATVLGHKLNGAGHRIIQVYGRSSIGAETLASALNTTFTTSLHNINPQAELYLVAISDTAIEAVVRGLHLPEKIIVHTAAAVSKEVLRNSSTHYGVLYPLQSLQKRSTYLPDVPLLIDASNGETLKQLHNLASSISKQVFAATDSERLKLHLAAVFCNNFGNHLFVLMQEYCNSEGLDFELLKPLIRETAERIDTINPAAAQTGPAIRGDDATLYKHQVLLNNHPKLQAFYNLFTQSIRLQSDL